MNRTTRSALIGTGMVIALVATAAAPAMAATPRELSTIQATGKAATQARIVSLNAAIPRVTSNAFLAPSDRATILATLYGDLAAMQSLQAKIAADTDVGTARADVQSIYTGYRVYAVAIPQSLYAASADALTDSGIPALLSAQKALQLALAGPDKAKDTPAIEAQLADLATQIGTAQASIAGVSAFALSVTPAQYNADHGVWGDTRAKVKAAVQATKAASADAKAIRAALK